ncbi:hypothetical protein HJG60_011533 [Phyllostomus discolor]|uniref:Uncharacterized protein n=1 Tax=Phyllostomus discolor TaxID=89673 RepID=A0A834E180_9CHIR|nr:hypothetical protein HJG60_011533 [Phyllostomus discolor]
MSLSRCIGPCVHPSSPPHFCLRAPPFPGSLPSSTGPLAACPTPLSTQSQPGLSVSAYLHFSTLRGIPLRTRGFYLASLLPSLRHRHSALKAGHSTLVGVERRRWALGKSHFMLSLVDAAGKGPGLESGGGNPRPSSAMNMATASEQLTLSCAQAAPLSDAAVHPSCLQSSLVCLTNT